ncbi:AAA family ATPase [Marinomonas communis]|uniref:AAA family ATPase n=1 Tax=Marinomonas communis TaxID=28254 RepID=UPI0013C3599F|nr:AAA family ATPase [Marinomonas communis]
MKINRKENPEDISKSKLASIFEYIGFDAKIGLKYHIENEDDFKDIEIFDKKMFYFYKKIKNGFDEVYWIDLGGDWFKSNLKLNDLDFVAYENNLIKSGVRLKKTFFLSKNGKSIASTKASSGELHQLSLLLFIASNIRINSIVLIDEPENSLHPKWQKEYIARLNDLFFIYRPQIVLATHSPLFISDFNKDNESFFDYNNFTYDIYEIKGSKLNYKQASSNLEEIFLDKFDVLTPENHYLSNLIIELINEMNSGHQSPENVLSKLKHYYDISYDDKQKNLIRSIASEIQNGRLL